MRVAIKYSNLELAWIYENRTLVRKVAHAKFCKKFNRTDVSFDNYHGLCKRMGWKTGRSGRYEKGAVPQNKGKKMPFNANRARTQFKKGHLPKNTKYLGHERVNVDGYVEISIAEQNPHTGADRRYVHKHRYLWIKTNGPIPEDHCLKCLDGNKQNTDPANWEAVPRAMLPRLNGIYGRGYDQAAPEVKPVIMAIAKVEHKARSIQSGSSQKKSNRQEVQS